MARDRNAKDNVSSAESVNSSEEETESEYTVERVVDKRVTKGKVSSNHGSKKIDANISQLKEN